jgi:hypothetical protein
MSTSQTEADLYEHVACQYEILEYHNILAILDHITGFHCSGEGIPPRYFLLLAAIDSIFDLKVTESEKSEKLIPAIIDAVKRKVFSIINRMAFLETNTRLRELNHMSPLEIAAHKLMHRFKDDENIYGYDVKDFKGKI